MASILKNQILKHLSKFTKNLSPDKINLSTLKGEGELSNLELDEKILMDLMDLPTWMKLTKAVCNKVSVKIQWTKLKSQPICLYLDEVVLEMETCSEPRPPNNPSHLSSYRSGGRYGFVDKVIDGMYVHINSVTVQFNSQKFLANLQLSRVKVQSLTPNWNQFSDLRQSRIRNEVDGEILLFKEIDWQTTRIEANARDDDLATPLRLIANQSKIRIILKKKLSDCSIISSRVILLLDDILWVLTDTQLKAAILYTNSLHDMIEKSTQQSKRLAAEKLQKQKQAQSYHGQMHQNQQVQQQHKQSRSLTTELKYFQKYDVTTTSYHVITGRIDLHLCDDTPPDKESSPNHNRQIDGGAMQVTFCKLSVDFYPFHEAGGERKQWYRYADNQGSRNAWVGKLFQAFGEEARKVRRTCQAFSPSDSPTRPSSKQTSPARPPPRPSPPAVPRRPGQSPAHQNSSPAHAQGQTAVKPKLLESCMVLRIEEFIIYRISTSDNKRSTPKKFFCSDKKALHLPSDMSMVHIEYTDYFFTEGSSEHPVPHANLYVLVNPVRLTVDYLTLLWANYFSLNLAQYLETQVIDNEKREHVDVKIEALMPRVLLSSEEKVENQPDRPDSIQIQISKITASNTHVEEKFTLDDLKDLIKQYHSCNLIHQTEFPNNENNYLAIPKGFIDFAESRLNPYLNKYAYNLVQGRIPDGYPELAYGSEGSTKILQTNTLKRDQRCDMWAVCVDQVWLEFLDVPTNRTRPIPFVESIPVTFWVFRPYLFPDKVVEDFSGDREVFSSPTKKWGTNENSNCSKQDSRPSKIRLKEYYSTSSEDSIDTDSKSCDSDKNEKGNGELKEEYSCDKSTVVGNVQYVSGQVANFNAIAKIGGKLRAQMNHSQYLFLMRTLESFKKFQMQMNADIEQFLTGDVTPPTTFSIPLTISELEFALVCPYIAELLPLTHPADLGSPISDSSEQQNGCQDADSDLVPDAEGQMYARPAYGEGVLVNGSEGQYLTVSHTTGEGVLVNDSEEQYLTVSHTTGEGVLVNDSDEQYLTVTHTTGGPAIEISESRPGESHLLKSQSDSRIARHIQPHEDGMREMQHEEGMRRDSHSTDDVSVEEASLPVISKDVHYITASDSGLSSMASSEGQRSRSASKLTSQAMKKSFTTGVNNISNLMGKLKNKLDPDDISDDSDRLSIKTDLSDEDFEFLVTDETEMPAFSHAAHSDSTSTLDETDDLSSVFADSTSASKAKELVSTIVFRLLGLELLLQGTGPDMFARLQAKRIDVEETGNIVYEDFYMRLSSSRGIIRETPDLSKTSYPLKVKFISGPAAEKRAPKGTDLGFMDARIHRNKFEINMSSLSHMLSFIEDEKAGIPIPMHVSVSDLTIVLKEDRPGPPSGQPAPAPTVMNIHELFIRRHDDGVFHIASGVEVRRGFSVQEEEEIPLHSVTFPTQKDTISGSTAFGQGQLAALQNKNRQLNELVEQPDKHSQDQDSELEKLKTKLAKLEWDREKLKNENEELVKLNNVLEMDNGQMTQRVVDLEEDLKTARIERDSLDTMLKYLNDELMASEQRNRKNTGNSMKS